MLDMLGFVYRKQVAIDFTDDITETRKAAAVRH
jgi:hypothetical protein